MIRPSVLAFVTVTLAVLSVSSVPAESPSPPQVETDLEHALTLLDSSMSERGAKWRCHPTPRSFHCSKDGCNEVPDTVWFNLDFASLKYERCDMKGCDGYPMTSSTSGIYTIISLPSNSGAFLKAVNDGSEFVEVTTLGTATWNYFGQCIRQ